MLPPETVRWGVLPGLRDPCRGLQVWSALGARVRRGLRWGARRLPSLMLEDAEGPWCTALPASSPAGLGRRGRRFWSAGPPRLRLRAGLRAAHGCSAGRGTAGLGGRRRPSRGAGTLWSRRDLWPRTGPRTEAASVCRPLVFLEFGSRLCRMGLFRPRLSVSSSKHPSPPATLGVHLRCAWSIREFVLGDGFSESAVVKEASVVQNRDGKPARPRAWGAGPAWPLGRTVPHVLEPAGLSVALPGFVRACRPGLQTHTGGLRSCGLGRARP